MAVRIRRITNLVIVLLIIIIIITGYGLFLIYSELLSVKGELSSKKTELSGRQIAETISAESILIETNKLREEVGAPPLDINERLNASASLMVRDMLRYKYFAHINPVTGINGIKGFAFPIMQGACKSIGENLQMLPVTRLRSGAKEVVQSWKGSKLHYEGMIKSKYRYMGYSSTVYDGYIYSAQHFCEPE